MLSAYESYKIFFVKQYKSIDIIWLITSIIASFFFRNVMGPVLTRLADLLELSPISKPGLFRELNKDYFRRIEAIDFTVKHDDGAGLSTIGNADIILVGVSRASKTPLSVYLSYRGWKVANVPIILDVPIPDELKTVDQRRIIGLTVNPQVLRIIRVEREKKLGKTNVEDYTDIRNIQKEVLYANKIFKEMGWPVLDVTNKSIEESATIIMQMIYSRTGERKKTLPEEERNDKK